MGDHRASIKIEFTMHGVTRKCDMWINWSPEDWPYGLDRRVVEFFEKAVQLAMDAFHREQAEIEDRTAQRQREADEREFERLKQKLGKT